MIEYERLINFCLKYKINFEEFILLYSVNLRSQNAEPELFTLMGQYYATVDKDWYDMVESLEERGFLHINARNKKLRKFLLRDLMIEDFFVDLLFTDPEEVWRQFLDRYPLKGLSPDGTATFNSAILADAEKDKEYFIKNILRNTTKDKIVEILNTIEEMFDWDGERTNKYANVAISRFIRNWDTYLKMHREENPKKDDWRIRRV